MTSLQRDILRRHGLASICALLFNLLFILSYHWQSPDPRPDALYGMSLVYWLVQLAMLYWVVDGRSRHYRDPSMTLIFSRLGHYLYFGFTGSRTGKSYAGTDDLPDHYAVRNFPA